MKRQQLPETCDMLMFLLFTAYFLSSMIFSRKNSVSLHLFFSMGMILMISNTP